MKRLHILALTFLSIFIASAQGKYEGKFEQLGTMLPSPNVYRTASGAPGPDYWQQKADYNIKVSINDQTQVLTGEETITYYNNSPNPLIYLWVQLDQNIRTPESVASKTEKQRMGSQIPSKMLKASTEFSGYEGGYKITKVTDQNGNGLNHTINGTMMRIDLPTVLSTGDTFTFNIDWSYNIYDRMYVDGRGGYEFFPEDGNYAYTIAQWYPRVAVYSDFEGWQNKQFLGRGEFALTFGDFNVEITVPEDHIVAATGELQNAKDVLSKTHLKRFEKAKKSFDKPVIIVTQEEAIENEKEKATKSKTWVFKADNVRDFAFASSRKYIWDAQAVQVGDKTPLAMSFYPKEGNPLWEEESTKAVKNTLITYSKHTIDYPYPVAISVHAANQGMEYPMICFNYGRPSEDGTYSQRTKEGMVGVIVHEVGHNFFPMIINSDERQWTWMDEGLNSFMEHVTLKEHYSDFDLTWGTPEGVINYMKGSKEFIRPIMTQSDNILQFGYNAYGKPSAGLVMLRETIMGEELFDYAFKEYAKRWAFKHPTPADFFRTMEDASAVDLDWFWKGWFYSIDHVDISIDNVKWYKYTEDKKVLENQVDVQASAEPGGENKNNSFENGPSFFTITETPDQYYGEFKNRVDDSEVVAKAKDKNFYEVTFSNKGGLVMPLILEWHYTDGTTEKEVIPAEIWRRNENEVSKVFVKEKEVAKLVFDPEGELADVEPTNNTFPSADLESAFDKFKKENEN
ncbi:M1 family metallopeptidase [Marinigracilibium pacificum]|uniref:M1 family metallopeptidase n=1 Tax=Marinigracilibium pacificum TaxID=2729599 RepID=A0A848IQV9_9BACT|nr:M1 family metallopeptidase [Marinigracilibium pacificum]NMM46843.1 M1 family metallopeptidase [Marinigracilibium pacificum]